METTVLVLAGKKWKVPRVLKRSLQIVVSVGLTLLVVLFVQVGGSLLAGRASSLQTATTDWLAFIKQAYHARPPARSLLGRQRNSHMISA